MATPTSIEQMQDVSAYKELRQTVATGASPVVAIVGAGLSAPAGIPTWAALRLRLVQELRGKASRLPGASDAQALSGEADSIQRMPSYWAAFERLEEKLGRATYQAEIRTALAIADNADIPEAYKALWRTPIRGVMTVNLDSFVRRGFAEVHRGSELKWFTGRDAGRLARLVHGNHPFAFNLHGNLDDSETWVFTHRELSALYRNPGYEQLLRTVFSTCTVLFLGISADDVAIGGPLTTLLNERIQGPTHFWLTDRADHATDTWAERAGVRVLPYRAIEGDHDLVVKVLEDLAGAVAAEVDAPPVVHSTSLMVANLPDPDTLAARPLEEIRATLNGHARDVLAGPGGEEAFDRFVLEYDEAVHRAWYTSVQPPKNQLFGYELHELVAKGAFGRVFRASSPGGENVAIKALLAEIRQEPEMLKAFRRGVQAMRILEKHKLPGMVAYREASEIPAFVTMEWIDGPNLAQAKEAQLLREWDEILRVAVEIVEAVKRAHDLPERVLHRDIRPANIMLRNGWLPDPADWELVVLDFDLSTFRGARQKSVLAQGSALGYLAPEQLDEHTKVSTRSAAVDSFGIGMTLSFLCSGVEPEANMQRHRDYAGLVEQATRKPGGARWLSLPRRVARLIEQATADVQSERLDLSQIRRELRRLRDVQLDPRKTIVDNDLLCEEIATRCATMRNSYTWDVDQDAAVIRRPGGLEVRLRGAPESDRLYLSVGWTATGVEDRARLSRYLPERTDRAAGALRSGPWSGVKPTTERQSARIAAELLTTEGQKRLGDAASSLDSAIAALQFSDI